MHKQEVTIYDVARKAKVSMATVFAYFTGYSMDPHERIFALLAFKDAESFVFTPALNVEEAKNSAWDGDVYGYLDSEDPWGVISTTIRQRTKEFKNWAIEKDDLSVAHYQNLRSKFPDASFTNDVSAFIPKSNKTRSLGLMVFIVGPRCGFAAFAPACTIVSKLSCMTPFCNFNW